MWRKSRSYGILLEYNFVISNWNLIVYIPSMKIFLDKSLFIGMHIYLLYLRVTRFNTP